MSNTHEGRTAKEWYQLYNRAAFRKETDEQVTRCRELGDACIDALITKPKGIAELKRAAGIAWKCLFVNPDTHELENQTPNPDVTHVFGPGLCPNCRERLTAAFRACGIWRD